MGGLTLILGGSTEREEGRGVQGRTASIVAASRPREGAPPERMASGTSEVPLRLTRRGRLLLVTLAAVVGLVIGFLGGRADAASDGAAPAEVVVEEGDTLWAFAREVAGPGQDVRDVVLAIQRLNGLATADLTPGDVLLLPAPR